MSKDTGFDAFFNAVTRSPEFKNVMSKDWSGDLENGLKDLEKNIKKASEIDTVFKNTFTSPEAVEAGKNLGTSSQTQAKKAKTSDNNDRKLTVTPEYFTMTNPDTWGFNGYAGMQELKDDLRSNFIRPLQFLFLVKSLKEKYKNIPEEDIQNDEEKKEKMLVDLYESYEKFQVGIPTGVLLYGPPGTGKTYLARKLSEELNAGLIKKSVGEFGSSYLHETSKNIREFFDAAKKASEAGPIILFLDEIDSLVSKRDNRVDSNKAEEVSQFLQEFNALEEAPNLIVIAATNRPDHLDSALLRSGRLDKKYYIGPPDFEARKELFKIFIEKQKRPHSEIHYEKLAELTEGYVAADIEAIVEEAARDASGNILETAKKIQDFTGDLGELQNDLKNHVISQALLEVAIFDTIPSLKMVDMSVFENWEKTLK